VRVAAAPAALVHPLLGARGVAHGFGTRGAPEPRGLVRPRQVHGRAVARLSARGGVAPAEADAIVADVAGAIVGVVTADCVPILVADADGARVAAVHAGWRGLAAGVIEASIEALAGAGSEPGGLHAVIGPCIGRCCYEIDAPVVEALAARFPDSIAGALDPVDAERHRLDLAALAREALVRTGVARGAVGGFPDACTRCDAERFHSYRRDGAGAGRLVHWIQVRRSQG